MSELTDELEAQLGSFGDVHLKPEQATAIIAALEDRDRLRESNDRLRELIRATEQKCNRLETLRLAAQAWADARFHGRHETPQIKALIAALAVVSPKAALEEKP
jgi:hypothetical protein